MNKLITGILTVFLVAAGIIGVYTPNALATPTSPLETCGGNNAMAQQGNSAAEQEKRTKSSIRYKRTSRYTRIKCIKRK